MSVHQKMILTKDGKMITAKKLKKMQKMSLIFVMKVEYDDDISPLLYGWGEGYTRSQQSIWLKFIAIVSTNGNASYLSNLFYYSSKSFG